MDIINTPIEIERINRLKIVLAEKNRTGKWLAEQIGKNEATISRWCSNKVQPSVSQLNEIANILGVDIRDLLKSSKQEING
ncbi:helix-turn-helix transcriptional regulator [uncultured Duncaniella sp.]|uniref:helix-turn-helix transcriptional regulator n=1 Tax=uncultured Duncaniella sp. TaxID=2768039 RepID=UPI00272D2429|nr:helix-turn-helix transcriptional regulator [uncultured Duncaniella sp.]